MRLVLRGRVSIAPLRMMASPSMRLSELSRRAPMKCSAQAASGAEGMNIDQEAIDKLGVEGSGLVGNGPEEPSASAEDQAYDNSLSDAEKRKMRELQRKRERNRTKLLEKWANLPAEEVARRMKISAVNRGRQPWNKGKSRDPEVRAKIAEKTREAMRSPEIRNKLKSVPKGPMSDETRQRISESVRRRFAVKLEERIEEIVQAEGITREEAEQRVRASRSPSDTSGKSDRALYMSEEHREKIRNRVRELWATPEYRMRVVERIRAKDSQERRLIGAGKGRGGGLPTMNHLADASASEEASNAPSNKVIFQVYQDEQAQREGSGGEASTSGGREGAAAASAAATAAAAAAAVAATATVSATATVTAEVRPQATAGQLHEERHRTAERKHHLMLRTRRAPTISTLLKTLRKQITESDKRLKEFDDKFVTVKQSLERLEVIRSVLDHRVAIVGSGPDRDALVEQHRRCLVGIQETGLRIRDSVNDRAQLAAQREAKVIAEQALLQAVGRVERGEHSATDLATVDQVVALATAVSEGRLDAFSTFSARSADPEPRGDGVGDDEGGLRGPWGDRAAEGQPQPPVPVPGLDREGGGSAVHGGRPSPLPSTSSGKYASLV